MGSPIAADESAHIHICLVGNVVELLECDVGSCVAVLYYAVGAICGQGPELNLACSVIPNREVAGGIYAQILYQGICAYGLNQRNVSVEVLYGVVSTEKGTLEINVFLGGELGLSCLFAEGYVCVGGYVAEVQILCNLHYL